jgi:hypothetical protein
MATTIKLKNGSGAPLTGDLVQGEPALDLTNKRLYTEDSGGSVIEVGTNPTSLTTGTFTSTGIDDNATSTAVTIDASNNVGIGTTTPNNAYALDVVGSIRATSSAGSTIIANRTSNPGSVELQYSGTQTAQFSAVSGGGVSTYVGSTPIEAMRIDSNGNVGIGTNVFSNAAQVLVAKGDSSVSTSDANASGFNFTAVPDTTTGKVGIGFKTHNETAAAVAALYATPISQYRNALTARYNADINGGYFSIEQLVPQTSTVIDRLHIDASGRVGIGTTSPSGVLAVTDGANALIVGQSGENFYSGNTHRFFSQNYTTEHLHINASGNVGIGTSSPLTKLHISGGDPSIRLTPSSTNDARIDFTDNTGTVRWYTGFDESSGNYVVAADESGFASSNIVAVNDSGNVGIGTSSPNTSLDVVGSTTGGSGVVDTIRLRNTGTSLGDGARIQFTAGTSTSGAAIASTGVALNSADLRFYSGGNTERMRIDASGALLVSLTTNTSGNGATGKINVRQDGISATTAPILAANEAGSGSLIMFSGNGGGVGTANRIYHGGASVVYATSSDERLKKNITPAPSAVAVLNSVEAVSFDWKATDQHTKYGFIAQQFVDVVPDAVIKGSTDDEPWGMDYGKVTPFLLKAIQEQQAMIEELKAEVTALKGA